MNNKEWRLHAEDSSQLPRCYPYSQMIENGDKVLDILNNDGLLLLATDPENFQVGDFYKYISTILGPSHSYLGGTSPRREIHKGLYEATRLPADYSILLHQEMSYLNHMPRFIVFFVVHQAPFGGASVIGDMECVINALPKNVWNYFRNRKLRLKRLLFSDKSKYFLQDIHKSWQEVFLTREQGAVEYIAEQKGWKWRWLEHDVLELLQDSHPVARYHEASAKYIWCNQAHIFHLACQKLWAMKDGRKKSLADLEFAEEHYANYLDQMVFEDGSKIDEEMASQVFHTVKDIEVNVPLEKGNILILDNLRFGHGRQPFSGTRELLVTMHQNALIN